MADTSTPWVAGAPTTGALTKPIADAVFNVLSPYLTTHGRKKFRAEVAAAKSVQQVLQITEDWMATKDFLQTPDLTDRLNEARMGFEQKLPGETPRELMHRLAT